MLASRPMPKLAALIVVPAFWLMMAPLLLLARLGLIDGARLAQQGRRPPPGER